MLRLDLSGFTRSARDVLGIELMFRAMRAGREDGHVERKCASKRLQILALSRSEMCR
jgi:hypothetical protein